MLIGLSQRGDKIIEHENLEMKLISIIAVAGELPARELSWEWIGDVSELYSVGDVVLVRVSEIKNIEEIENLKIVANVKTTVPNTVAEKLKSCKIQGKYAVIVTDIHGGIVFVKLSQGVNVVAHSCLDRRTPGKKDNVSFVVTHINDKQNVAMGIITRIIKQNI